MKSRNQKLIRIVFIILLIPLFSFGNNETQKASPQDFQEKASQTEWVHAMEASLQKLPVEKTELKWSEIIFSWLGWTIALMFFIVLLTLHIKMKKREEFLLRGGDRDFFVLPPARNRRSRPR